MLLNSQQQNQFIQFVENNQKLQAIQLIREANQCSLADAVKAFDYLQNQYAQRGQIYGITWQDIEASNKKKRFAFIPKLLLIIAGIVLVISGIIYYTLQSQIQKSIPVQGIVVGFHLSSGTLTPILEYEYQGEALRLYGSVYTNKTALQVGDSLQIFLPTDTDAQPIIDQFWEKYFAILSLFFVGMVLLIIGSLFYWKFKT